MRSLSRGARRALQRRSKDLKISPVNLKFTGLFSLFYMSYGGKVMRYVLMNKDKEITDFEVKSYYGGSYAVADIKKCNRKDLPYGYHLKDDDGNLENGLSLWLSNRSATSHNNRADYILCALKLYDEDRFIRTTHASSLNDTFWVRAKDEKVSWKDVSLYDKNYEESVSKANIGINGAYNALKDTYSDEIRIRHLPELLHRGSFPRMFENTENGIYFYKTDGIENNLYSEMMASEVSECFSDKYYLPYHITEKYGKKVCGCRVFTDENTGLITPYYLLNGIYPEADEVFDLCKNLGFEEEYRRMLVFDALIFNTDRHLNNFGFLMDNDTLEIKGFAPFYDQNLCLFGSLYEEDFKHPDRHIYYRKPRFWNDFTKMGQEMITDSIASDVEKMKDFSFKFKGDECFSETMVRGTENIIHMQARALLDKTLTSKTAFVIEKTDEEILDEKYNKAVFRANSIYRIVFGNNNNYTAEIEKDDKNKTVLIKAEDTGHMGSMVIDMMSLSVTSSGKQFDEETELQIQSILNAFKA